METYETLFITSPTLAEEEERTTVDALAGIITDGGGNMVANERWGRRRLAYPIEKHEDGVYVRFLYDSDIEIPKELERRIRLSDKVLRALTVRLTHDWAEDAKKQAVIDAERRAEAEQRAKEEAETKAKEEAEAKIKEAADAAEAAAAAAAAPPPPVEAATEAAAEAPAETPAEAKTETPAEAKTETPAEAKTETPAEAPTEPAADAPTDEEAKD